MGYDVSKIPPIMRNKGWSKGAALMDRWLGGASNDKPENGKPDTSTIKMSWVLGFDRAREVYDEMISSRVWVNAKGQEQIVKMLNAQGKLTGQNVWFGGPTWDVPALDRSYVQYRPVGSYASDEYDDLLAALGRFVFRAAVAGWVVASGGRHQVQVTQVAIYVRDSYDFNGDQRLGVWSDTEFIGGWSMVRGTLVTNETFRKWREENGRGGDFIVYSDAKVTRLNGADTFWV